MESLEILGFTKDYRTDTNVLYAQILINEYFELIGQNYNKFQLQRKKEKHKGYNRLKKDLQQGALIPSITLAVEPNIASDFLPYFKAKDRKSLLTQLKKTKENIYILDGLQRTHKIKELLDADITFNKDQKLLLEIWVEPEISHLIYRLIVLNSGQKPMSMRHQIELLFTTMRQTLVKEIKGLEVLVENEDSRRTKPRQFTFERLVTSYYSFLMKSPEVDKSSIVSERLMEERIMEEDEAYLSHSFKMFKAYLSIYCELDEELFRICKGDGDMKGFRNWFADANVINSFFSALGKSYENKKDRVDSALNQLIKDLSGAKKGEDILKLNKYQEIREEVADPKKYNVGYATRLLLSKSFFEYFRDEGETPLYDCWIQESINLKR